MINVSYLTDKVLTEGWGDPFPGVYATVHPDSFLFLSSVHSNLEDKLGTSNTVHSRILLVFASFCCFGVQLLPCWLLGARRDHIWTRRWRFR